jgi:hypothetical protein
MVICAPFTLQASGTAPVAVIVAWVAACTAVIEAVLATKPALKPMARSRERDFFTAMPGEGAIAARLRVSRLFIKTMRVNNSKGLNLTLLAGGLHPSKSPQTLSPSNGGGDPIFWYLLLLCGDWAASLGLVEG